MVAGYFLLIVNSSHVETDSALMIRIFEQGERGGGEGEEERENTRE